MRLHLAALAAALVATPLVAAPNAAEATWNDVTCSPSAAVVVGCDQLVPHPEHFSPGDFGVFRYVSRAPARNVNRISVRTHATNTAERFELSFWEGTADIATNRLGVCVVQDVVPDAWNSCSIPDVWVADGEYRYVGILQPEQDGGDVYIRTAVQWGNAPEYLHVDRALTTTPSSFTTGMAFSGAAPASFYADDAEPPEVTFATRPANLTKNQTASWSWSADEPATFACSLDGDAFTSCASPHQLSGLPEGAHELRVRATDSAGNQATLTDDWTIDLTPPSITFSQAPADGSATSATWAWTADDAAATFTCALDQAVYASCNSPTSVHGISVGAHEFHVRATDAAGNSSVADDPFTITPPGPSANLWIDLDGGACTRSATPSAYNDADACGSFALAYDAAASGDEVLIVDGTGGDDYGAQAIPTGSKVVTFAAAGTKPEIGRLLAGASNVTLKDLIVEDRGSPTEVCQGSQYSIVFVCATDQTYDGVVIDGLDNTGTPSTSPVSCPHQGMDSGQYVIDRMVFRNGEVRNIRDAKGIGVGGADITFENNTFHDITAHNYCYFDVHNECMYLSEVPGFTLRNNRFIGCPTQSVFFTNWHQSTYGDVTIEGNLFGHTLDASQEFHAGSCSLAITAGPTRLDNWHVRYNTFETAPCVEDLPGDGTSTWKGNLGGGVYGCPATWVYSFNVGETCGGVGDRPVANATNTRLAPDQAPFYVDAPGDDFHLVAGSAAIEAGDPNDFPATDLDGAARTAPPDAGAFAYAGPDTTAPVVTFTQRPPGTSTSTSASWAWTANDASAAFECALDGGAFAPCASPATLTGIGVGAHEFHVRATDPDDNAGTYSDGFTVSEPGPEANLWVDPDGGSCVRQSTPAVYSDADACGSFASAYAAAGAGDEVKVVDEPGGDDYGAQAIPTGTKDVSFTAATTKPEIGRLIAGGSNVTVEDVIVEDRGVPAGVCDGAQYSILLVCGTGQTFTGVVVDGLNSTGSLGSCPHHGIDSGPYVIDGLTFQDGVIRNIRDAAGVWIGGADITFEGNAFVGLTAHDHCGAGVFTACMRLAEVPGFTLRGNTFTRCPKEGVRFTNWHTSAYGDVTIEGNVFGHPEDTSQEFHTGCALSIEDNVGGASFVLVDWQVRYNTLEVPACIGSSLTPGANNHWKGNLGGGTGCTAAFAYSYNVGQTCAGTGDQSVAGAVNTPANPNQAPFYVDAPSDDFHLAAGSAAIGAGDAGDHPSHDLDGVARGNPPDAGAYEYTGG